MKRAPLTPQLWGESQRFPQNWGAGGGFIIGGDQTIMTTSRFLGLAVAGLLTVPLGLAGAAKLGHRSGHGQETGHSEGQMLVILGRRPAPAPQIIEMIPLQVYLVLPK